MEQQRFTNVLLLIGLSGLGAIYATWALCDSLTEMGGDSATYMLMARELSPFTRADSITVQFATGATFPPLFPAMIGLLGGSFFAAHALVVLALTVSLYLLFVWFRDEGLNSYGGAIAILLFALMPGTYLLALNIWSENPYLFCSLLTLLAASRAERSNAAASSRWWWIASIACAAAVMIRTAGLPLLLTLTAFLAIRRKPRWSWMILTSWSPLLLWLAWSHLHASGATLYTQQLYALYGHDALGHLREQVFLEAQALTMAWLTSWLGNFAPWQLILLIAGFASVCVLGWVTRLLHGRFDAIYIMLYSLMLLAWPWPGEAPRLLYVVTPILVCYGMLTVQQLSDRVGYRPALIIKFGVSTMLGLAILPSFLITMGRRLAPVPAEISVVKHISGYYSDDVRQERRVAWAQAQILDDLQTVAEHVPPSDCIFQIKPSVVVLLSGRMSRGPPLPSSSDEAFASLSQQCHYAYLMKLRSPTFPTEFYPRDRLHENYRVLTVLTDKMSPNHEMLAELIELFPAVP